MSAEELADLERDGYVVLDRVLTPAQLDALREDLAPWLDRTPRGRNDFEGERTTRVYALLGKAPAAAPLVEHPRVLDLVGALLQANYLLTACQAIELHPGETEQPVHYDDGFYPLPRPRPPVSISTIWAVDDFTAENGATEVIPGSHRWGDGRVPGAGDGFVPVVMAAGSVVVFSGTLWHRGGANRSQGRRCAISPQYCQPWARQQENMMLALGPGAATLSPRIQAMLGYSIHPPFMGFVDGLHPSRLLDAGYDAAASGAGTAASRFWSDGGQSAGPHRA